MRHARASQRLSRRTEHRDAMLSNMVRNLLMHGQIHTTIPKAKVAKRLADRLITLGKEGSVHARRRAYQVLKDRSLVKLLFAEVAPRFLDCSGGYTRVVRLHHRPGDGTPLALLAFTRLPVEAPKAHPKAKTAKAPEPSPAPSKAPEAAPKKPKRFLEGLRGLFRRKAGEQNP